MKLRITYREFSILAGIVVAAIILFIWWLQPLNGEASVNSGSEAQEWVLPSAGVVIHKMHAVLQLLL